MEDKFMMMDVLATEKSLVVNTAFAMNEASSEHIYNKYSSLFENFSEEVKEIFTICYNNGWYKLEEAQSTKIDQEVTKMLGEINKED